MILKKIKDCFAYFKRINFSKKDIIYLTSSIILSIVLLIPVNYTVTVGGGVIDLNKYITVSNRKDNNGFNACYVKELNGTVFSYILGVIVPSYEITPLSNVTLSNEDKKSYEERERSYFTSSLDSATIVAYKYANKFIKIVKENLYISYIDENANTNIKLGDKIKEIDGVKINTFSDIEKVLSRFDVNDLVDIIVERNNKDEKCFVKLININNSRKMGVSIITTYDYELNPKISFKFSNKETGPSGGLMVSLTVYNQLIDQDITKGKKISGTGTIDINGNVGEIGGVKYKLSAAYKNNSDIFIVPYGNLDEALKIKKEKGYDIEIIGVSSFKEAIEKLEKIN